MSFLDARELKRRADMLAIAGKYTRLRRSGRQYVGLCPLHSETRPSFYVHPERKVFYCFGCGAGGDLFRLVMLAEGYSFSEAVDLVARIPGDRRTRPAVFAGRVTQEAKPIRRRRPAVVLSVFSSRCCPSQKEHAVLQPADLARACEPETMASFIHQKPDNSP